MTETLEATVNSFGQVILHDKITLKKGRRATVTIFDDEEPVKVTEPEWTLRGSAFLVNEDLESASREIADEINAALERSGEELRKSME